MGLDTELQYYETHQADLLRTHRGQVILIQVETVGGAFSTEAEAYRIGRARYGDRPFLIIRVEEGPPPHPTGQRLLQHSGFLAQAGMSDEEIERLIDTIYGERAHRQPRDVDVE
ncbi:MAG: hypothetical protein AB1671_28035 [Thermodesulfobacteriota bacterium]